MDPVSRYFTRRSSKSYRRRSGSSYLGSEGNLLHPAPNVLDRIQLTKPVLTLNQLDKIEQSKFNVKHLSTLYQDISLEEALNHIGEEAV
ncbi:glutamate synthase central domain-containing protein, partial [Streptococcus pneumoniae]|uniref:glutamate synthase central domain-containing protein n=1 Tax=Streptococcus pneumoniae TaxID=1313 RepID=UPI001CB784B9